jgi:hypothetical protein
MDAAGLVRPAMVQCVTTPIARWRTSMLDSVTGRRLAAVVKAAKESSLKLMVLKSNGVR